MHFPPYRSISIQIVILSIILVNLFSNISSNDLYERSSYPRRVSWRYRYPKLTKRPSIKINRKRSESYGQYSPFLSSKRSASLIHTENNFHCPHECVCSNQIVHCQRRHLKTIPRNLRENSIKLDLSGNEIKEIKFNDFRHLINLRILNLHNNNISRIAAGAFDNLNELNILTLSYNNLQELPMNLFNKLRKLKKLNLRNNQLKFFPNDISLDMSNLRILKLEKNRLTCIDREAFNSMKNLQYLSIHTNKLEHLEENLFNHLKHLQILRLTNNPLKCDCKNEWIKIFLLNKPINFSPYTFCKKSNDQLEDFRKLVVRCLPDNQERIDTTNRLKYRKYLNLRRKYLHLRKRTKRSTMKTCRMKEEQKKRQIKRMSSYQLGKKFTVSSNLPKQLEKIGKPDNLCPTNCRCKRSVIYCDDKKLEELPQNIPTSAVILRLNKNKIKRIDKKSLSHLKNLRQLDLSDNVIENIDDESFHNLKNLKVLRLHGNRLKSINENLLKNNEKLSLLLLNGNHITCVHPNAFSNLKQLTLLSFYDNYLTTISNGTLKNLKQLLTLHLGQNPLECSCELLWLHKYLMIHPIEKSGAKCLMKENEKQINIGHHTPHWNEDKCSISSVHECGARKISECPAECQCSNRIMNCMNKSLSSIKFIEGEDKYEEINLSHNNLTECPDIRTRAMLKKINLKNNRISEISEKCFASSLQEINLQNNRLNCNLCQMKLLNKWYKKHKQLTSIVNCGKEKEFLGFHDNDFNCGEMMTDVSVGKIRLMSTSHIQCPAHCLCYGKVMRCTRYHHRTIPKIELIHPISMNWTTEYEQLFMDYNQLRTISQTDFLHIQHLKKLDLSNNKLKYLEKWSFEKLEDLEILLLNDNQLECLHVKLFEKLKRLRTLTLNGNRLSSINVQLFQHLPQLSYLTLRYNDLECGCQTELLGRYLKKKSFTEQQLQCGNVNKPMYLMKPIEHNCKNMVSIRTNDCLDDCIDKEFCECKSKFSNTSSCSISENVNEVKCFKGELMKDNRCLCSYKWTGDHCDILKMISLTNRLNGEEASIKEWPRVIDMRIRSKLSDGIIFQIRQSAFDGWRSNGMLKLTGELFHGRMRITHSLGNDRSITLFSYDHINNNNWHRLLIRIYSKNMSLEIDGRESRKLIISPSLDEEKKKYKLSDKITMKLGNIFWNEKKVSKNIRSSSGFVGCISEMRMNGKRINLKGYYNEKKGIIDRCIESDGKEIGRYIKLEKKRKNNGRFGEMADGRPNDILRRNRLLNERCASHKRIEGKCIASHTTFCHVSNGVNLCVCHSSYYGAYCEKTKKMNDKLLMNDVYVDDRNPFRKSKRLLDKRKRMNSTKNLPFCNQQYRTKYLIDENTGCRSLRKLRLSKCRNQSPFDKKITNEYVCFNENEITIKQCCSIQQQRHLLIRFTCRSGSLYRKRIGITTLCQCKIC
ncbi:hypothetical protein SNEBB_000563 [Seison nebaliae]|nr:hypothetical protein SNEBB_000563 [Seison nebaliae]